MVECKGFTNYSFLNQGDFHPYPNRRGCEMNRVYIEYSGAHTWAMALEV